jgi:hypothetical protein
MKRPSKKQALGKLAKILNRYTSYEETPDLLSKELLGVKYNPKSIVLIFPSVRHRASFRKNGTVKLTETMT